METWDWGRLVPFCHAVARAHTRDRQLAEEAAQEAALRAWRYSDRCASADPRPWLATITRREILRLGARQSGRPTVPLDELEEHGEECVELMLAPERDAVQRALANLGDRERLLVHLRYQEDLTQTAIASQMQMAEGTVKVLLHRARKRLHKALTEDHANGAP